MIPVRLADISKRDQALLKANRAALRKENAIGNKDRNQYSCFNVSFFLFYFSH
jgi:hypothetical protein